MLYKLKCYSIISTYNKTKPFALRALINKDSLIPTTLHFLICKHPQITCTIFFWIVIMLIPLIFLLPNFFSNKVFAVFLAKPVSDILAAAVTTITFFTLFNKILKKEVR